MCLVLYLECLKIRMINVIVLLIQANNSWLSYESASNYNWLVLGQMCLSTILYAMDETTIWSLVIQSPQIYILKVGPWLL